MRLQSKSLFKIFILLLVFVGIYYLISTYGFEIAVRFLAPLFIGLLFIALFFAIVNKSKSMSTLNKLVEKFKKK